MSWVWMVWKLCGVMCTVGLGRVMCGRGGVGCGGVDWVGLEWWDVLDGVV